MTGMGRISRIARGRISPGHPVDPSAHVPATSRFCPECQRFVRGGPSNARAAAVITTVVGMPFAVVLIVLIEVTVAIFGLLGFVVVLAGR